MKKTPKDKECRKLLKCPTTWRCPFKGKNRFVCGESKSIGCCYVCTEYDHHYCALSREDPFIIFVKRNIYLKLMREKK